MISQSAVCLDRRVENPPAVEAGGVTTWTLPYPVAVDGSEGTVVVVRLDTEAVLATTRPSPTTVAAVGSFAASPVVAGIAYTLVYTPSTIYYRGSDGQYDRRAPVRLSRLRAFLSGTKALDCAVSVKGRATFTNQFRTDEPEEGQALVVPIFSDSTRAALTFSDSSPWPVRLGVLEWEGQVDPQSTPFVAQ